MSKPKGLYRTVITIWSDYAPQGMEIDDLAREAMQGDAYCSQQETDYITNPSEFPSTEFFDDGRSEDDEWIAALESRPMSDWSAEELERYNSLTGQ